MQSQSEHLKRLKTMLPDLPPFPLELKDGATPGCKIHKMSCGTSISWNLLNQPEISCAKWFVSNGTIFPTHAHEQREWLIVYKGSMHMTIEGQDEKRLLPGMSLIIEPNVKHSARTMEDCWFLATVIPKSKDWPHE